MNPGRDSSKRIILSIQAGGGGYDEDVMIRGCDQPEFTFISYLTGHCIIGATGEYDQWQPALHGQLICKVNTEGQTCNEVNVITHVLEFLSQNNPVGGR